MFSQEIQSVLRQQGWSPERKVLIRDWLIQLESVGYTVIPQAQYILQNFGGLEIIPIKTLEDAFSPQVVRFDPVTEILSEFYRIEYWQDHLGQKLSPIGVLYPSEAILLIAENDGKVFCEWGNILGECGNSFEDALESTLLFARRKILLRKN